MRSHKIKRLLVLGVCIIMTVFGLYMQFIHKPDNVDVEPQQKTENTKEKENMNNEFDMAEKELPNEDNKIDDESYTDGEQIDVFFTNTTSIDGSGLPLNAHTNLCKNSQKFLYRNGYEDVAELSILDDTFLENEKMITFECDMKVYDEKLKIVFDKNESKLKFSIVTTEEY